MWDTPANATWNRGKRNITLNLKQPDDLAIATRLVGSADVVIENFRPGVMDRLGIGPQAAERLNPRLIYCSMPGFASDDPRAQVRAFEGVVGSATATYRPHDPAADQPWNRPGSSARTTTGEAPARCSAARSTPSRPPR